MRDNLSASRDESLPSASPDVGIPKNKRGFAVMDPVLVRELARRGGVAAHRAGTAHEFSSDEARTAGRKGGIALHARSSEKTTPKVTG
jgi:general stress protein YciG